MIQYDFNEFLHQNLTSIKEIAEKTGINIATLYLIKKRGSIKPNDLKKLVKNYPDARLYEKRGSL